MLPNYMWVLGYRIVPAKLSLPNSLHQNLHQNDRWWILPYDVDIFAMSSNSFRLQWNLSIWTLENAHTCVKWTPSHGPESHPIYLRWVCTCDLRTSPYSKIGTAMCGPATLTQCFYYLHIADRQGTVVASKFLVQLEVSYFKYTSTMNVAV